jgi:hypothetical protein
MQHTHLVHFMQIVTLFHIYSYFFNSAFKNKREKKITEKYRQNRKTMYHNFNTMFQLNKNQIQKNLQSLIYCWSKMSKLLDANLRMRNKNS